MGLPVHRLFTRVGRSFLVEHRGVLTLVDTGTKKDPPRIARALERLGRKPDDVRQILLTHAHGDHAGGAKGMKDLSGAEVFVGAEDAEVLAGRAPYPPAVAAWGRMLYTNRLKNYPRFEADHALKDRTEVEGGLEMIPAPGHTDGTWPCGRPICKRSSSATRCGTCPTSGSRGRRSLPTAPRTTNRCGS